MYSSFSFADTAVGYIIEGFFDEEIVKNLHDEILQKASVFRRINLYLEDSNIENFSVWAVLVDIAFKFRNSEKFTKVAIVTDRTWIRACAAVENLFFEGVVKSFPSKKRMDAMAWISS